MFNRNTSVRIWKEMYQQLLENYNVMESENYFIRNKESDKLNIYTTKEHYQGLPLDEKKFISSHCLFSRQQQCWISKAKLGNSEHLLRWLSQNEFEDKGEQGQVLSFSEQVEKEKERAQQRAVQLNNSAERADKQATQLYDQASKLSSAIPFGQPILVGHHSENRDRRYRDRIHNKFGKAFETMDKAEYLRKEAQSAEFVAKGEKYSDPFYLQARIKECNASIRQLERKLQGKFYAHSPERVISEREQIYYKEKLEAENSKLNFHVDCMKKIVPDYVNDPHELVRRKSNKHKP